MGADVDTVRKGMGADPRIRSRFLYPGIGYGGSCFPKDVKALRKSASDVGYDFRVLTSVMNVNDDQKTILFVDPMKEHFRRVARRHQGGHVGIGVQARNGRHSRGPSTLHD